MPLDAIAGVTDRKETEEHGFKSEVRALRQEVNKLRRQVSYMMPGVINSAPALKTGTTSAKELRVEAFTMSARGLIESVAAAETAFTATTHDLAATKEAWFVLSVATGGGLTIVKAADQTVGTIVLPIAPDNEIVVGYVGIVSGSSGFNATTDDLAIAGTIITSLTFIDAPFVRPVNAWRE